MKKIFYLMAVCAAAAACAKQNPETLPEVGNETEERVHFQVSLPENMTKLTEITQEDKIENLQVFIFTHNSGSLDGYFSADAPTVDVNCTPGKKTIYAIANAEDLSGISTELELKNHTTYTTNVKQNHLVMTGSIVHDVYQNPTPVVIPVTRRMARIALGKVTNSIEMPQYSKKDFVIKAVFLLNVPGDYSLYGKPAFHSYWYNKGGLVPEDKDIPFIYDAIDNVKIAHKTSYTDKHYFYTYPNISEDNTNHTRLVIETTLDGHTYYYSAELIDIQPNNTYTVNIEITRPGSENPAENVIKIVANTSVSVTDWTDNKATDRVI